jgi:hypothetical protein
MSYVGQVYTADILGADDPRYFYALRRTEDGMVYFAKIDQLIGTDSLSINNPGVASGNFENFEYGVDYFDGRSAVDHTRPYANLKYDQYRWDAKNIFYYIDSQGNLVARTNAVYNYS